MTNPWRWTGYGLSKNQNINSNNSYLIFKPKNLLIMKKIFFTVLMAFPGIMYAQNAKIKIDVERTIGEIDPKIYGVFMEPITISGRRGLPDSPQVNTLYGNLYDPSSPLADENGFKKNYIEAMKELKVTNIRWPGGNFLMGYNW